jgi:hypothetical protein
MAFLGPSHPVIKVLLLNICHIVPTLFLESLFIIRPLHPFELASQGIEFNFSFELFLFNKTGLFQNSIKRLLSRILVKPLVLRHIIIVHLLVDNILSDIIRAIPLHKFVRMKDGFGAFLGHLLQLLLIEGWEEGLIAVIYDQSGVRPSDNFAAVQTGAFALLGTNHLATAQAVINQFVLLGHAIALDSVQIYLSWLVTFCFFHLYLNIYYQSILISEANFINTMQN